MLRFQRSCGIGRYSFLQADLPKSFRVWRSSLRARQIIVLISLLGVAACGDSPTPGNGGNAPVVQFSAATLSFGNQQLNTPSSDHTLNVTNVGKQNLSISTV